VSDSWVKNYRKITKWKYYRKDGYAHLWQHLIRKVQFEDRYNINGQLVKRGQVDCSIRQLAIETGLNRGKVSRILDALSTETQIVTVHKGKNPKNLSIIQIVNYDQYQDREMTETVNVTVACRQRDNFKKEKKVKNKNIEQFDFEAPYKLYPRKRGKTPGMKKLQSQIKNDEMYQEFCIAIKNYALEVEGRTQDGIKYFSTFVSEWKDWVNIELPESREEMDEKILTMIARD